jgi:phosphocarrier protein HPr
VAAGDAAGNAAAGGGPLVRRVTIVNRRGLHARAAAKFVKAAERFGAEVKVTKDDLTVTGTSILGLMMLAAGIGSTLTLAAEGEDAQAAMDALCGLVEGGFGEED